MIYTDNFIPARGKNEDHRAEKNTFITGENSGGAESFGAKEASFSQIVSKLALMEEGKYVGKIWKPKIAFEMTFAHKQASLARYASSVSGLTRVWSLCFSRKQHMLRTIFPNHLRRKRSNV